MTPRWSVLLVAGCAAGASSSLPAARFANAPVVQAVNDRRDVPRPPSHRDYVADLYLFDGTFVRPVTRALELPRSHRAQGVNALDEVPDSTWFTNRIGTHDLTPAEIERGPITHDPEQARPWKLLKRKTSGTSIGLIVEDAQGVKYMLKLEGKDDPPELETATDAIIDRLMWACGYNVPEDLVVYFRPDELVLASGKPSRDRDGHPIAARRDPAAVVQLLDGARRDKDGRYRALASRWIEGKTLGGHPGEGVRKDDPNDRIPHELRRELRGMYTIDAWLDAVDVTEGQFVDAWEADPADPKRHYVTHYVIDFGKSLGAMGGIGHDWWRGFAYRIDIVEILKEIVTLGLDGRPWQHHVAPKIVGVSPLFDATFSPGSWHPDTPGYMPFQLADRFDKFWAAAIIARFTPEQLHAAVSAGRFTDPRAVDYIASTLAERQRETIAYWFTQVNPLDHVAMDGERLCFDDLAITDGLDTGERTTYTFASYDFRGRPIAANWFAYPQSGGRTCAPVHFAPPGDTHGYTIVRIATERPGFAGTTYVYIGRDLATGLARVVGLWRE